MVYVGGVCDDFCIPKNFHSRADHCKSGFIRFGPFEKLRNTVDLIVMASVRKCEDFVQKLAEPGRLPGQVDLTRLKARALSFHAHELVAFWLDSDGHGHAGRRICPELLNEMQAGARLLDEDAIGLMFACKADQLVP